MKVFVKPNGTELPVNSNSEAHALSLGWLPKESPAPDVTRSEEADDDTFESAPQKRKYTRRV